MARKCVIHNTYTPFFVLLAGLEPGTSPFSSFLAKSRGDVRDGTSGTGVRSLGPRFQPAAGENFF